MLKVREILLTIDQHIDAESLDTFTGLFLTFTACRLQGRLSADITWPIGQESR